MSAMDVNAKCEKIEAAFFRLPAKSGNSATDWLSTIMHKPNKKWPVKLSKVRRTKLLDQLIPGIAARHLVRMRLDARSAQEENRVRELPTVAPTDSLSQSDLKALSRGPRPPSAKELHQLSRALEALANLSPAAQDMLSRKYPSFLIHANVLRAEIQIKRGQPEKVQKMEIARVVARYYYYRTGKNPAVGTQEGRAYGLFLQLLTTVYEILGIEGGCEAQARDVAQGWGSATGTLRTLIDEKSTIRSF